METLINSECYNVETRNPPQLQPNPCTYCVRTENGAGYAEQQQFGTMTAGVKFDFAPGHYTAHQPVIGPHRQS